MDGRVQRRPLARKARRALRFTLPCLLAAVLAAGTNLTPDQQAVVDHISAASLRGNLSFISSDLLEGRATPSRGLDLAAEYIAAQFRRAGLEPAGGDDYFQTANLLQLTPDPNGFEMTLRHGEETVTVPRKNLVSRVTHNVA